MKGSLESDDTAPASQSTEPTARPPANYVLGELLGRGGMGEVVLAEDRKIGRRVAIKRMRAAEPSPDAVARFLREARIQAHLDHPAIVPVHELGTDSAGRPYFTMKRLAGTTLHDLLRTGTATLQKLLRAFVDVCLAIELAHTRGVIHRDLKPANIMLGDYGEVYVLDWGVARVVGDVELGGVVVPAVDGETEQGTVLGTIGYMSPEQLRGEDVTTATDVYALGAILFEILTGQPLHPRGAAMESTLAETAWSPAQRVPERGIAPELDAACAAALVADPTARPRAGELADRVQRYLDGDRDLERRRALAAEHLTAAQAALAAGERPDAVRLAGRALALDPESRDAAALVTQLVLQPPDPPPPGLAARLADFDRDDMARQGRQAAFGLVAYLVFVPVFAILGVRDWSVVIAISSLAIVMMIGSVLVARRRLPSVTWAVIGNVVLTCVLARLYGPLVLGPALAVATVSALASFPTLRPSFGISAMAVAVIAPLVLEQLGVLSPLVTFSSSQITITPDAIAFDATSTPIVIAAGHVAIILIAGGFVSVLARARRDAQRKLAGQQWMLEQAIAVDRA